ncbi:hypothetical protein BDV12DRAFT_124713 [Aspergillus spectabilis]
MAGPDCFQPHSPRTRTRACDGVHPHLTLGTGSRTTSSTSAALAHHDTAEPATWNLPRFDVRTGILYCNGGFALPCIILAYRNSDGIDNLNSTTVLYSLCSLIALWDSFLLCYKFGPKLLGSHTCSHESSMYLASVSKTNGASHFWETDY